MSGTAKDNLGPSMHLSVSLPFPLEKLFEAQIMKSVWTFERILKNVQPVLLSRISGYNAPLTKTCWMVETQKWLLRVKTESH